MSERAASSTAYAGHRSIAYPYLVCGAVALGIVGLAAVESRVDLQRAERTLRTARAQVQVVERAGEVVFEMNERLGALRTELSAYQRLDAPAMNAVLSAVVEAMPDGVVLDAILLRAEENGVRAEITGVVSDAVGLERLEHDLDRVFASARIAADHESVQRSAGTAFRASFSIEAGDARPAAGVGS